LEIAKFAPIAITKNFFLFEKAKKNQRFILKKNPGLPVLLDF